MLAAWGTSWHDSESVPGVSARDGIPRGLPESAGRCQEGSGVRATSLPVVATIAATCRAETRLEESLLKPELLAELSVPYPPGRPGESAGRGLAEALGASAKHIWVLDDEVNRDLDPQQGGIRWMAGLIDPQRSCMIGEHLLQCVWSMHTNLLECALHVAEADDWLDRESAAMSRSVSIGRSGKPQIATPQPRHPLDELPAPMSDLHVGGVFRAIGSALDCTGSSWLAYSGFLPIC